MLKEFPYNQIIRKALKLTWQNKWLWILGIFLFNFVDFNFLNFTARDTNTNNFRGDEIWAAISRQAGESSLIWALINTAILVVVFFLLYISAVAKGGIISSAFKLNENQESGLDVNLRSSIRDGRMFAWRLIGLSVASTSILILFIIILVGPIFYLIQAGLETRAIILSLLAVLIFAILFFIVSFTVTFGSNFVVLANMSLRQAVSAGFDLFSKRWLVVLFMSLRVLIITLVAVLGFTILAGIGASLLLLLTSWIASDSVLFVVFVIAAVMAAIAVLVLGAAISAWQTVVWTLVWLELTKPRKLEEIEPSEAQALAEPSSG